MKFTGNKNAPNCRILAKEYLGCRMLHDLMEQSSWDSLGLVNLPGDKTTSSYDKQPAAPSRASGMPSPLESPNKKPDGGGSGRKPGGSITTS